MELSKNEYIKVGFSPDLFGRDRVLYRALEIFPGFLSWATLIGMVVVSYAFPIGAALFIIVFDLYWLIKTVFLSLHLRANWRRMQEHMAIDWRERLGRLRWEHIWQLVILPMSREEYDVVHDSLLSLQKSSWPKDRMIVVLSYEARSGVQGELVSDRAHKEFGGVFPHFFSFAHPANIASEIPGKGGNETWAAKEIIRSFIDPCGISYENIVVSSFDIDTQVYPQYFEVLTWHFLTAKNPLRSSYQPVPVYHNNIWSAPSLSRVVATSGTFWQMMQQERPERLTTFSSHSMSLRALVDVGYWQTNIVSEDSRIFWNMLLHYDGAYESIPMSYPVSMDANLAPTFWQTMKNVYKQQRRWAWGVENFPYVVFGFLKNRAIPVRKKIYYVFNLIEGFWSWSTNAIMIFALGWLPLLLGGREFNSLVLAYNLPTITRTIMTFAMLGMVTSAIISLSLLPPRPAGHSRFRMLGMALQWILVPITIIFFGSFPALDAQTRLMFGKYLGFWVTPKHRK